MPTREYDVLVIGEGLAGVTAAASAAGEGARTALVSKGAGSFALEDGCIEVHAAANNSSDTFGSQEDVRRACMFFKTVASAAGCEYRGSFEESMFVPTQLGTFREVAMAPLYLGECDVRRLRRVVVAGFAGSLDFDADFVAHRLATKAKQEGFASDFEPRILKFNGTRQFSAQEIAARFDRDSVFRRSAIGVLTRIAENADALILPGLLGWRTTTSELREIAAQVGCPICEVATLPPSILGMRLLGRLEGYLARVGVELSMGFPVSELLLSNGVCQGVELETPGRVRQLRAHATVLATGEFSHLLRERVATPLPVNQDLQVCDATGQPIADGLFACGGVIRASGTVPENAFAMLTGVRAGKLASTLGSHHAQR